MLICALAAPAEAMQMRRRRSSHSRGRGRSGGRGRASRSAALRGHYDSSRDDHHDDERTVAAHEPDPVMASAMASWVRPVIRVTLGQTARIYQICPGVIGNGASAEFTPDPEPIIAPLILTDTISG